MFLSAKKFDIEINEISRILVKTENARYFDRIETENGIPYIFDKRTTSVTYGNENGYVFAICNTSIKNDDINLSCFSPCIVTNDSYYSYSPLIVKNVFFYGAIEVERHSYNLFIKLYFNKKRSVRHISLPIKHLSNEKLIEVISILNLATERIDIDCFKFEELDSPLICINSTVLLHKLISNMKYRIYEQHINRPGRDDHFNLLKGIMNIPKNEYFKKLVTTSLKVNSSSDFLRYFQTKLSSNVIEKEVANVTLSHDSGWTVFPKPNDNVEQGNFQVDLFIVDIIRKFNKYEYLLDELKITLKELPDKWDMQDSRNLLVLMKAIVKEKLRLNENYSSWHSDSKLKEIEKEFRTKFSHFGFLFKIENVFFRNGELKANFFSKCSTVTSIPQYFENNHWLQSTIFVPITYSDNIEKFFLLDEEIYNIYDNLKKAGLTK